MDGWHRTADELPPKGVDVLILFQDGGVKVKRIYDKTGAPRWGMVGGGIALEKAPWWRELPEKPDGFVATPRGRPRKPARLNVIINKG